MKRLRIITVLSLVATIIAVGVATYNLVGLYHSEKAKTMEVVRECAINADILEMISRMESSYKASQSFIRLNTFVEFAQQKDGRIANADTVNTSLGSLLRLGLEFTDNKQFTDYAVLDSIFNEELHRHNLYPSVAMILPPDSLVNGAAAYWTSTCFIHSNQRPSYKLYVSPMRGEVLSHLWGIVVPFICVIFIFAFLSAYLIRTVKKLRTIEEMKDDLTHNLTHELKTPVAVAYAAADSMLRYYDQSDEARNKRFLKIIMQRLSYLSGMIENILSMSMERFKSMTLDKETVDVKDLVKDVASNIELKADKPVKLEIDVPDNLFVTADALHLGNILSNLLDNAVKYSGEKVNITVRADRQHIIIADDGIGIDKKNLSYIFDKFYRVASGERYDVGGYGLGLFYVKQVVELHGWAISVTSKPGVGTQFIIKINEDEER